MISREQCRAARAFLGWTLEDLAQQCNLSRAAVNTFEQGTGNPRKESIEAITNALERAGVEFTDEPGVRMRGRRLEVRRWDGEAVYEHMLNDIFETALKTKCEILFSGLNERLFIGTDTDKKLMTKQALRLREHGIKERVLAKEHDKYFTFPPDVTTYRWLPQHTFGMAPSITYGDKLAFLTFSHEVSMVIIENADIADVHRKQFDVLWSIAKPIPLTDSELAAICQKNLPL